MENNKLDIKNRKIELLVSKEEIAKRKTEMQLKPNRNRVVSKSLEIYAKCIANASKGAVVSN